MFEYSFPFSVLLYWISLPLVYNKPFTMHLVWQLLLFEFACYLGIKVNPEVRGLEKMVYILLPLLVLAIIIVGSIILSVCRWRQYVKTRELENALMRKQKRTSTLAEKDANSTEPAL
jgi:hypothetical protein